MICILFALDITISKRSDSYLNIEAPHAPPSPGGAFHTPNRGPRIRITRDNMPRITKNSVNWQKHAPTKTCANCKYVERIEKKGYRGIIYFDGSRCTLNGFKTGGLAICDKWTEKVDE